MCAEGLGEHYGADAVAGELTVGEPRPVSSAALFCAYDARARLTHGSQLSAAIDLNAGSFISKMYANFGKS